MRATCRVVADAGPKYSNHREEQTANETG
jgi:hypothetical protein